MTTHHSKKAGNRPPSSNPRPALRGGVYWRGARKRPPAFIPHKNRTSGLLSNPCLHCPSGRAESGPSRGAKTADRHNRATGVRHRVSPTRWGWDAAHSPEGPQTPSNGPTRGKRREGRPAHAKRPRHGSHGLLKRGGFRLLLKLEFFVGETLRRGNSQMLQPPGENF